MIAEGHAADYDVTLLAVDDAPLFRQIVSVNAGVVVGVTLDVLQRIGFRIKIKY